MKRVGVLFGIENAFPGAVVERINALEVDDVRAEFVSVGAVRMDAPCPYAVILDRISHDMPFYRAWLKNAALAGTQVINNPFWWSADDKFFNYALATRLGVAIPPTVLLPHKRFPPEINERSVRNLEYPLDWDAIFEYVGFPAFLKPHDGGGWRNVSCVHNREEFFAAYDETGDLTMVLQRAVDFEQYFRCFVVGGEDVRVMPYDPRQPHEFRYLRDAPAYPEGMLERVAADARTLCRTLGYDINTVEFAVREGVPYAIDFLNPAPDADPSTVGEKNFLWIVDAVARLAIERAQEPVGLTGVLRWAPALAEKGMARRGGGEAPARRAARKKALVGEQAEEKRALRSAARTRGPGTAARQHDQGEN